MQKTVARISCLLLSSLAVLLGATACVVAPPAPYEEFVLAKAAVRAAQDVDAARFATGLWNRADDSLREGTKSFKEAEYKEAKEYFVKAIDFAERAENATRLKKFQSGDSFP